MPDTQQEFTSSAFARAYLALQQFEEQPQYGPHESDIRVAMEAPSRSRALYRGDYHSNQRRRNINKLMINYYTGKGGDQYPCPHPYDEKRPINEWDLYD